MTIAKIHQNTSPRATLGYVLNKSGASIIGGNAAAWVEWDELTEAEQTDLLTETTARFAIAQALNPIKQPVYHISLSLPPHEALDDAAFSELSDQYLAGLILSAEQPELLPQLNDAQLTAAIERFRQEELPKYFYVAVRHTDQPHPHVHLVVAKINLETTTAIPTSYDRYRSQVVLRYLERQYGLSVQPNSWEVGRKAESTQQAQTELKTGQMSVHKQLQIILEQAAASSQTVPEFIEQAQAHGVEVQMQFTRTEKSKGISYSLDGVAMTGHALGTRYSFREGDPGLVKHLGLSYEPERDRALIQALCQRPVVRESLPQIDFPAPAPSLIMNHPELQTLALRQLAEETEEDDEGQSLLDNLEPLSDQTNSASIAAMEIPSTAPLESPQQGQSDLELESLPLVTDAPQPPPPQPIEVGLAAMGTG
ncbi:relaxase/mobilization nuclease domain-containing protein (plasmid) [Kovacikia minuta CCNUW1]|uniref:relaxase/mobilization nuclease domain-containing protein n=1 Tax=Kovacikia minuta TaxID=2931930 RepID=UPI001CCA6B4B|nr:relaxase/mobilization nuclease domain-containing protein [Kovacikia minuta]UBF30760.1 relaxase/mobilization nuclease domain-containing protein [Kovacikia minuta CCNUW1]